MKTKKSLLALLLLAAAFTLLNSCGHHDPYRDGIVWDGDNKGTLELINGSNRDMIVFIGQTPAKSSILGGVRAGATRKVDISKHVDDFAVGGYAIIRGVTKEEWDKNPDPTKAKIEFNAMVTYRNGALYRYNIDRNFMGDNGFRVVNRGRIGMELRKDSPDGEKVAYLPALQQNQIVYAETTDGITLFPVYVFYNKITGEVTTFKSPDIFQSITVGPRPLLDPEFATVYFPNDQSLTWESIVDNLKQPVAYMKVFNNITNQSGYVTNALNRRLISQNGYNTINSGENLVFELPSTEDGTGISLIVVLYGGNILVPVLFEGETNLPIIKNGYDYTVNVSYSAGEGGIANNNNYKATIVEGKKRDISDQIESL